MKYFLLILTAFLIHNSIYALAPPSEFYKEKEVKKIEMVEILDNVLDVDENKFVAQLDVKDKIIIMDQNFNNIREATTEEYKALNNQSILVPIIYRSEFIIKVHNVSYYMLEKK